MTLVLAGILTATATTYFNASEFELQAARSELIDAIRFAQQRSMNSTGADGDADGLTDYYTVHISGGGFQITLDDADSSSPVPNPASGATGYSHGWGSSITLTPAATIRFSGRGEPSCTPACSTSDLTLTLSDAQQGLDVTLVRLTGYVR